MAIRSESLDLRGLTVQVDAMEVNGTEIDSADFVTVAAFVADVTASAAEINYNDITTLGTGAASKAVVLDAGEDYVWPVAGVLTYGVLKDSAGTTLGATAAELNLNDASAQAEVIAQGGVVSVVKRVTKLTQSAAGAITLAAPGADMLGVVKVIEQVDGGTDAVTLSLANVDGGSAATTASFNATGETLILVGGVSKWHVIKEIGVTLS
jgi:hypothetical protein